MTFPVVEATNTSQEAGTTSHTVSLPASIAAGDLLIILLFAYDPGLGGPPDLSTPSGWTQLYDIDDAVSSLAGYYRIADGSEGASVNVVSSNNSNSVHNSYRISGFTGTPEVSARATGVSATPNPPSHTPSWGAADTLWLAITHCANTAADLTAPTNYTNIIQANDGAFSTGSARRELNAASEDPGTFAGADAAVWSALTMSIQGESAGAASKMKYYKQRRAA